MTRTAKEIAKILISAYMLAEGSKIKICRMRTGHIQRSNGAWSWFAIYSDPKSVRTICGSQYSCKEIIKAYKENKELISIYYSGNDAPELLIENNF